eukprot:4537357-Amphidinium_carterae.1
MNGERRLSGYRARDKMSRDPQSGELFTTHRLDEIGDALCMGSERLLSQSFPSRAEEDSVVQGALPSTEKATIVRSQSVLL